MLCPLAFLDLKNFLQRAIGRAIVDYDELDLFRSWLSDRRSERYANVVLDVEGRDYHGQNRLAAASIH